MWTVKDAFVEAADEVHVVDALIAEMARIVVEAERGMPVHGFDGAFGADRVEGDLGRMDFKAKPDPELLVRVEDRSPAGGEVGEAVVDHGGRHRREGVEQVPDRTADEAVHDREPQRPGRFAGADHLVGGPLPHLFRIAVAPHARRQDRFVPGVDPVADGLTDQVVADREQFQAVLFEQFPARGRVGVRAQVDLPRDRPSRRVRRRRSRSRGRAGRDRRRAGRPTGR